MISMMDIFKPVITITIMTIVFYITRSVLQGYQEVNIEIIKNAEEYKIYENCYLLDDKYYCYNEVKK